MTPQTLRRKLQKKKKHKPYRKCPKCGRRTNVVLTEGDHDGWHLFKVCGSLEFKHLYHCSENAYSKPNADGCDYIEELFRSGGGIGRHIPHS